MKQNLQPDLESSAGITVQTSPVAEDLTQSGEVFWQARGQVVTFWVQNIGMISKDSHSFP